jgi:hypothetical protein
MNCLQEVENTLVGGKDNPDYHKAELAIENYIKQYSLMVAIPTPNSTISVPTTTPKSIPTNDDNLEKFRKLVTTCYKNGNPSATELQLVEKFRQRYNIPQDITDLIIAEFTSSVVSNNAIEDYELMYRAFLENDGEIDLEEQAQLLDLQEELDLTNEQVSRIEANIQAEFKSK